MTASRMRRFVGGLTVGYLHTAIVTMVGLWLTPYLLRHLDQHDYGLWLLTAQVLFYLALTDLGVVALVPREVAFTTGRAAETAADDLRHLVGETTRLVIWQMPFAAIAGVAAWWVVSAEWPVLGGPLAVVVLTFVSTFPLRIFQAVLQGLQDLAFAGGAYLIAWTCRHHPHRRARRGGARPLRARGRLGVHANPWRRPRVVAVEAPVSSDPASAAAVPVAARRTRTPRSRRVDQRQPDRGGPAERHGSPRDRRAAGSRSRRAVRVHGQTGHAARESAATVHADGPACLERAARERAARAFVSGVHQHEPAPADFERRDCLRCPDHQRPVRLVVGRARSLCRSCGDRCSWCSGCSCVIGT